MLLQSSKLPIGKQAGVPQACLTSTLAGTGFQFGDSCRMCWHDKVNLQLQPEAWGCMRHSGSMGRLWSQQQSLWYQTPHGSPSLLKKSWWAPWGQHSGQMVGWHLDLFHPTWSFQRTTCFGLGKKMTQVHQRVSKALCVCGGVYSTAPELMMRPYATLMQQCHKCHSLKPCSSRTQGSSSWDLLCGLSLISN